MIPHVRPQGYWIWTRYPGITGPFHSLPEYAYIHHSVRVLLVRCASAPSTRCEIHVLVDARHGIAAWLSGPRTSKRPRRRYLASATHGQGCIRSTDTRTLFFYIDLSLLSGTRGTCSRMRRTTGAVCPGHPRVGCCRRKDRAAQSRLSPATIGPRQHHCIP